VSDATDQHADRTISTNLYAAAAAAHGAAVGAVTGFEGHGGVSSSWAHEEAAVAQAAAAVKAATDASWAAATRAHIDVVRQGGAAATCTQIDDVLTKATPRSQSPLLRADALPASSISPRFIETYHHLDLTREERALRGARSTWRGAQWHGPALLTRRTKRSSNRITSAAICPLMLHSHDFVDFYFFFPFLLHFRFRPFLSRCDHVSLKKIKHP
jgi:hypothetical protein